MSDRALQIGVGLSLAIHLIASVALSGDRWSTYVIHPPAATSPVPVRVWIASPAAQEVNAESALPTVAAPSRRPRPVRVEATPKRAVAVLIPVIKSDPLAEMPESEPLATEIAAIDLSSKAAEGTSHGGAADGGGSDGSSPDAMSSSGDSAAEAEDRLSRYVEQIRARILARKRYPTLARKRSIEGRVVARVAIRADGRIEAVEFDPSATLLLRRATDDAIRSAAPYPAPPAGDITIEFPIEYSLRDSS